jgi:hypothetical protein
MRTLKRWQSYLDRQILWQELPIEKPLIMSELVKDLEDLGTCKMEVGAATVEHRYGMRHKR